MVLAKRDQTDASLRASTFFGNNHSSICSSLFIVFCALKIFFVSYISVDIFVVSSSDLKNEQNCCNCFLLPNKQTSFKFAKHSLQFS